MATSEASAGDSFLSHLKRARIEIQDKFLSAHKTLQQSEADLLAKLQELEDEYTGTSTANTILDQINELVRSKDALVTALTGNANQEFLDENLANIDKRITELELKLKPSKDTYKNVTVDWDGEVFEKLSIIGKVLLNGVVGKQEPNLKKIEMPKVTFGTRSKFGPSCPGVFACTDGMTFHPKTHFLYICDSGKDCIQVFDKSYQFVFLFNEKMHGPDGICISQDKIYVTQTETDLFNIYTTEGKFLQSVGQKGDEHLEFETPRGICVSNEKKRIYIAEQGNHRFHCLNLDLTFHSLIDEKMGARDVKLTPEEIVLLSLENPCISLYSYDHQLIRKIVPHHKGFPLQNPLKFVLDNSFNILIADFDSNAVCIYSHEGEFLHKFGKEGKGKGEFIHPKGISISPNGHILVISDNPNHSVQVYQP